MAEPNDILFYIHGVTPNRTPAPHRALYRQLNDGITALRSDWPQTYSGAEWGWSPGENTPHDQELLSQAQNQLGHRVLPAVSNAKDFNINPARIALNQLRELNFYGFSDMFYYTSETGKQAVRSAIARQLLTFVNEQQPSPEKPVRISIIGHSAGCVIGLDLLFHLFHPEQAPYTSHCFVDGAAQDEAADLRRMARDGSLQIRRLITLGNPLAAMAFRHNRVVEAIAAGEKLNPAHYGLIPDDTLPGPRWINIWDRDDPLAWPVEPLMNTDSGAVKDVYVNVSDWITKAHSAYWTSKATHKAIAERW
jgi:hypothetical protein